MGGGRLNARCGRSITSVICISSAGGRPEGAGGDQPAPEAVHGQDHPGHPGPQPLHPGDQELMRRTDGVAVLMFCSL